MVDHIATEIVRPLWALPDDEVPIAEQRRRLTKFHAAKELADRDCQTVVELCSLWKDKGLYQHFAATWDAFCLEVLAIDPAWVDRLCAGFRLLRADGTTGMVPAQTALSRAEQVRQAAIATTQETAPGKQGERTDLCNLHKFTAEKRASEYGVSRRTQIKLDRLARDFPTLHTQVIKGELSTHAAAKAAGIVKDVPLVQQAVRLAARLTPDERAHLIAECVRLGTEPTP